MHIFQFVFLLTVNIRSLFDIRNYSIFVLIEYQIPLLDISSIRYSIYSLFDQNKYRIILYSKTLVWKATAVKAPAFCVMTLASKCTGLLKAQEPAWSKYACKRASVFRIFYPSATIPTMPQQLCLTIHTKNVITFTFTQEMNRDVQLRKLTGKSLVANSHESLSHGSLITPSPLHSLQVWIMLLSLLILV